MATNGSGPARPATLATPAISPAPDDDEPAASGGTFRRNPATSDDLTGPKSGGASAPREIGPPGWFRWHRRRGAAGESGAGAPVPGRIVRSTGGVAVETPADPLPRTCAFATYGCKVNQYETQAIRERLLDLGLREVDPDESPDLLVVNTCTVTAKGGSESRRFARRMAARHPETRVVVTGCHADSDPEDYADAGIHLVAGNAAKADLAERLGLAPAGDPSRPNADVTVRAAGDRTRAFVKIQDGCHLRCAYCIIPSVRPDLASKGADVVVAEVASLVAAGFREVVITGIHLGAYGREEGRPDALADVIARILDETCLERLRLSSIEVGEVSERLLSLLSDRTDRLAPHVHLPLQSGSDEVLRRMRRRYRTGSYLDLVRRIREEVPDPALTTDVLVGFPGETAEEALETLDLCREVGFLRIHVFPFSVRRGTPAASMPGRVPGPVIRERARHVEAVGRETGDAFRRRWLGRTVPVLVENRRRPDGGLTGLTDRYVRVDLPGEDDLMNRIVPVRLTALESDRVLGVPTA